MPEAPAPSARPAPEAGATYHRHPPEPPPGSRVAHLLPGALLAGAAAWLVKGAPPPPAAETAPWSAASLGFLGAVFLAQGLVAAARRLSLRPAVVRGWPWSSGGVADPLAARASHAWGSIAVWAIALAPAVHLVWTVAEPDRGFLSRRFLLAFAAVPVAGAILIALNASRKAMFSGKGSLAFAAFPFRIGHKLEARFFPGKSLFGKGRMRATLRCLEVVGSAGGGRVTCSEKWRWTEDVPWQETGVDVSIALTAAAALSTHARRPRRFWELEVGPYAPGASENARFVVPVYGI
jgi:hypothetical protein